MHLTLSASRFALACGSTRICFLLNRVEPQASAKRDAERVKKQNHGEFFTYILSGKNQKTNITLSRATCFHNYWRDAISAASSAAFASLASLSFLDSAACSAAFAASMLSSSCTVAAVSSDS